MSQNNEFETSPVAPQNLQPARHFAASYAGEHVAGTEFVIGAMFVAWGVGTSDILWGLLWGNLLAVLTWAFICAPIATDTRLTLYAYLQRIAGKGTIKVYSIVNGVLFCILAGAMVTVSASAVRILFDIPPQVNWYPTDLRFVLVSLVVGAVVVAIAIKGFRRVAQFAEVCAPWMILMFVAGALALYPSLRAATSEANGGSSADFFAVADQFIWQGNKSDLSVWHVAAFAWICNLAMHGGLSDMTILRFARRYQYGFFSALGMFIGHYLAWVCAGIMGAGAALLLQSSVTQLDAGAVAFEALGAAGILAVIIAGWTTSNPTIYRAGLAFHSLNPKWSRVKVTAVTGIATTIIACFPFVFSRLMDFVGLMGLLLAPVGAIIVTEHWLFPKFGLSRYWSHYKNQFTNVPAISAWFSSLLLALGLNYAGLHLYFLLLPSWIAATVIYTLMAAAMGARQTYAETKVLNDAERARKTAELEFLNSHKEHLEVKSKQGKLTLLYGFCALVSLLVCAVMAVWVFNGGELTVFKQWLWLPTLSYFVFALLWASVKERDSAAE